MLPAGKISPDDMDLIHLTDDVDEVVRIMLDADERRRRQEQRPVPVPRTCGQAELRACAGHVPG